MNKRVVRPPIAPMLAKLTHELPAGDSYIYEPKWDGFRSIVFRAGREVDMRSRNQGLFSRYFPELVEALEALPQTEFVIDGEIVVTGPDGFDFPALLNRVHPAASRVERLTRETPAAFIAFDALAIGSQDLRARPFAERRRALENLLREAAPPLHITPATSDAAVAALWLENFCGNGIDGVMAKDPLQPYVPGRRVMLKVKRERSLECVVAGFRCFAGSGTLASLLLGLYDAQGSLRHIGVVSSFSEARRNELMTLVLAYVTSLEGHVWEHGFGLEGQPLGRLRGAAGVWTPELSRDWIPIRPELVCEIAIGQLDHGRLRHPARFLNWRPDRDPASCTFDQLEPGEADVGAVLGETVS